MWENACNFVVASDNVVVLLMPTFGIGVNCVVSIGSCVHSAKNTNIVLLLQLYGNMTSLGSCEACIKCGCQRHQFPIVPLFSNGPVVFFFPGVAGADAAARLRPMVVLSWTPSEEWCQVQDAIVLSIAIKAK